MFKLADPEQTYKHRVRIRLPGSETEEREASFVAHFKLLSEEELTQGKRDEHLLASAMVGWDEIEDSDGQLLPFNSSNLEKLCAIGYWRTQVAMEYLSFWQGLPEKN